MKIKNIIISVVLFVVAIIAMSVALGSFYTVDEGERAVVLRNGKVVKVAEAGLDFKTPMLDTTKFISVRDHNTSMPLEAYSYDQQPAQIGVSVTYRVPVADVSRLYTTYGTVANMEDRVINRRTPDVVKNVFGKFTAARAIQEREKLGIDIYNALTNAVKNDPVQIVSVQVEAVAFSKAYLSSIEQRMLAQVEIETTKQRGQTAEVQAEIRVIQAKAEADAKREHAKAESDAIRMMGEAEAAAIDARGKALAANRGLVDLVAAEKWNGVLPTTMTPSGAVPFVNVNK